MEPLLLVYYSLLHALTPGHSKTLLIAAAVSGAGRRVVVRFAAGFGLAHGLAMMAAVGVGLFFKAGLNLFVERHDLALVNLSLYILGLAALFFVWQGWRIVREGREEEPERVSPTLMQRRPLLVGLMVGAIPCPDSIGMGLIVPNLIAEGQSPWPAMLIVWLTVAAAITGFGLAASLVPLRDAQRRWHLPEWLPAFGSALLCVGVICWRVVTA